MQTPIAYYNEQGVYIEELVDVIVPTQEELIAQKELQLLKMYEELQILKGQ
jgi:hypothetical protein